METGGQYTGSRSFRVAGTRRGVQANKKRKRLYINDSYIAMPQVTPYVNRVIADGGVVDQASIQCVNYELYKLEFLK